jgi:hypothetical protein
MRGDLKASCLKPSLVLTEAEEQPTAEAVEDRMAVHSTELVARGHKSTGEPEDLLNVLTHVKRPWTQQV